MTDIVARCCELTGRTPDELAAVIDKHDNWGGMVHAFEYLTVLGVVRDEIRAAS